MKRFTFTLALAACAVLVFSQTGRLRIPASIQSLRVAATKPIKGTAAPLKPQNYIPSVRNVSEDVIGGTVYDLQTNASDANRLYYFPSDVTMGGTWTRGISSPSFPERGTGYNYFQGGAWGPPPTGRIENQRVGWPSYAPLGPNGEIVVSHTDVAGLKVCTRATRGTGTWTQTILPGPTGAVDISWPRVVTSGPDHMIVHIICTTYTTYMGQDLALLYYRSSDGGVTWDKVNEILPGTDVTNYLGFNGDDYAWAEPKGDTLCFAVAGQWVDGFIMRSYDNGETWNKTIFFHNGNSLTPTSVPVDQFACLDGSVAVELDHTGKAHVVVGRMFANSDGSQRYYYPGTDGLIYWNEDMAPLQDSLNPDTLEAHGQLLGYVADNLAGDTIVGFPLYGVAMSSFPQITIDDNDDIFVIWSGLTVGNPSPDDYNYRHLWGRGSVNGGQTWADMYDFTSGLANLYSEFVYPSMAKYTPADVVEVLYQTADQPGSAVKDSNIPYHDNTIEVRGLDKALFLPVGIPGHESTHQNAVVSCYPNPATDKVTVTVNLAAPARVTARITDLAGRTVYAADYGLYPQGSGSLSIRLSNLNPGAYFLTVGINGEPITRKLIRE